MPIVSTVFIRPIEQQKFAELDYQVMRRAFDSQNELGRLCDETIYQNDLALRLEDAGLGPVRTEVPVTVTYNDFAKTYFLDLGFVRNATIPFGCARNRVPLDSSNRGCGNGVL